MPDALLGFNTSGETIHTDTTLNSVLAHSFDADCVSQLPNTSLHSHICQNRPRVSSVEVVKLSNKVSQDMKEE